MSQWNLPLRIAVAKFERVLHREQADPKLLLDGATAVLALLVPVQDLLLAQAMAGHPSGLLELALARAFNATALLQNDRPREALEEVKNAVQLAEAAVASAASTDSYHVWLKCLGIQTECDVNPSGDSSTAAKRRQAIAQVKAWLQGQTSMSHNHARLAFLCLEEEWFQAGRSLMASAQKATGPYNETQVDRLKRIYLVRSRALKSHEGRYGPTVEALLARADLERQYRQLLVTTAKGRSAAVERWVDNSATWSVLDRAAELWPYSERVKLARAGVFRIMWQYGEAVEQFEEVITSSRSGYRRRIAQIAAAEVLLTSVRYEQPVYGDRESALRQAAGHLVEPLGHNYKPDKVVVLRERIALEAGEAVDWHRMNSTFDELFRSDFPTSISKYLNRRRLQDAGEQSDESDERTDESSDLSELLYNDFTDIELITGLGHLYLRQSELLSTQAANPRPAYDQQLAIGAAKRAYDCFDAGRVVLEAHYGNEKTSNRFNRAQAIRVAATLERTVDPFPLCPRHEKSWLNLALRMYESVRARSVGSFHLLCHERYVETQELLRRFTSSQQQS
jgi:hypothetical protein